MIYALALAGLLLAGFLGYRLSKTAQSAERLATDFLFSLQARDELFVRAVIAKHGADLAQMDKANQPKPAPVRGGNVDVYEEIRAAYARRQDDEIPEFPEGV